MLAAVRGRHRARVGAGRPLRRPVRPAPLLRRACTSLLGADRGGVRASRPRVGAGRCVALTGALSTEVVESGPFTSLEQAMLATELAGSRAGPRLRGLQRGRRGRRVVRGAGRGAPDAACATCGRRRRRPALVPVFVPVALAGAVVAGTLTARSKPPPRPRAATATGLGPVASPMVRRLRRCSRWTPSAAASSCQAFIAYWLDRPLRRLRQRRRRRCSSPSALLQTGSFLVAPRLADRFGLLPTMVVHPPAVRTCCSPRSRSRPTCRSRSGCCWPAPRCRRWTSRPGRRT